MSLSCDCFDSSDFDWWFTVEDDFKPLATKQRRRCCSCNELITIGADSLSFSCWRRPETDIEERIHGEEVPLADKYMCEECGGLFLSLTDLGYCLSIGNPVGEDLAEYHELVKQEKDFKAKNRDE